MGADKSGGDDAVQITEETPAYRDELVTKPPIDPWVALTDAGDDDADVIDALGWEEQEFPPDGPVAAPIDQPHEQIDAALIPTADLEPPPPPKVRVPSMRSRMIDEMEPTHYQQEVRQLLSQPVVVPRKTAPRKSSGLGRRELTPPPKARAKAPVKSPERRYPKMLALLQDGEVPYGSAPKTEPPPPPVPGTFFPAPRTPLFERPPPADLDELLATMAEGLLIGESPDGGTEVRVTLRDEFFAGTELRIRVGNGEISAQLLPPDRDIYWQLNGNIEELRERLASRGLTVRELTVLEP